MAYTCMDIDNDYGQLRMRSCLPTQKARAVLNVVNALGWHRCNRLYQLHYPDGGDGILVLLTVCGEGCLHVGSESYRLTAQTAAVISPHQPMQYGTVSASPWEFYWINCNGAIVQHAADMFAACKRRVFPTRCLPSLAREMEAWLETDDTDKPAFELRTSIQLSRWMHMLLGEQFFAGAGHAGRHESDPVRELTEEIETHYAQPLSMEAISRRLYLSQTHLTRLFRSATGYTPYEYLKNFRLLKACELLQYTRLPCGEVGCAAGFANSSNFTQQFRRRFGITPTAYRRIFHGQGGA